MTIILRPHQVDAISDVNRLKMNPLYRAILCVLPTGAGKSLTLADYARNWYHANEKTIIFAHRDKLISQLSEALCKMGVPHGFICSDKAKRDITNRNLKKFGDSFYDELSPIIISSNPTFAARLKNGKLPMHYVWSVQHWIQDECFPAGTLVEGKPIEDIEVGDMVTCFDEVNQTFTKKPVVRLYKNKMHDMMCKVVIKPHHVVNCTLGHPFYTKRGWVKAYQLTENDEVLYDGSMSHVYEHGGTEHSVPETQAENDRQSVLFKGMFEEVCFENEFVNDGENKSEICVGQNEEKQSDAQRGLSEESFEHLERNGAPTKDKRWEWSATDRSGNETSQYVRDVWFQITSDTENGTGMVSTGLSETLQNRLWSQRLENSNRGRWFESYNDRTSRTGQTQGQVFNWTGVEGVSFYQPSNSGRTSDGYVYNIEVHDHHNYIANGVLVHNCHHVTMDSQLWGSCLKALKNADGLGFTATPIRGDKKGLGSHTDGIFDAMSVTTNMWELIQKGMLSAYKIYIPPTKVDLSGLSATSGGDYNQKQVAGRVDKREITGDAVEHYLRVASGQRAITFCVNIEHARHVADQFNKAGVPSAAVSSKDSDTYIQQTMESFENGLILNLVNVDLLGEGYDSPSISVGIMLRPTQSYSLFKQQFGRILRTTEGKTHGILLDHVGNVQFMMKQHNLTYIHDDPEWTLDRGTKRAKNDDGEKPVDTHTCPKCRYFWIVADHGDKCPDCGHDMSVKEREAEQRQIQVSEGNLVELSCDIIDELMREREKVDLPMEQFSNTTRNLPAVARHSANNNHAKRLHAQGVLRHAVQNWCERYGLETGFGVDTVRNQFQIEFGISVFHAQVLSERKALELTERIQQS